MSVLVKTAEKVDSVLDKGPETTLFDRQVTLNAKKIGAVVFAIGALIGGTREMVAGDNSSFGSVAGESIDGGFYIFGQGLGVAKSVGGSLIGFAGETLDGWGLEEVPNFFETAWDGVTDAKDTVNDGLQSTSD